MSRIWLFALAVVAFYYFVNRPTTPTVVTVQAPPPPPATQTNNQQQDTGKQIFDSILGLVNNIFSSLSKSSQTERN